jgi:hypothetical protein
MQSLNGRWYWCERCGTIKDTQTVIDVCDHETPALVARVKSLRELKYPTSADWHRLGINEAIELPEARPSPSSASGPDVRSNQ